MLISKQLTVRIDPYTKVLLKVYLFIYTVSMYFSQTCISSYTLSYEHMKLYMTVLFWIDSASELLVNSVAALNNVNTNTLLS